MMVLRQLTFVQMSGAPGSGKTTVARALGQATGAVVIDHDITKSALLAADMAASLAGRASYQVLNAVARDLLQQGHSVIFDSPCFYEELLARGIELAEECGATYRYVECMLNDLNELDRRLTTRTRMPSQIAGIYAPPTAGSGKSQSGTALIQHWIDNMKRPQSDYLTLNTAEPVEMCIARALEYVIDG